MIETGDMVFELFEENPRVLKVLENKNDVITAEIEHGVTMGHVRNFRLATEAEILAQK